MVDLTGRIAVLGLGRSGEAVVRWALDRPDSHAADVSVFVEHDNEVSRGAAGALRVRGVRVELGATEVPDEGFSLVVASPGISPARPLMVSAARLGVPVISELELAYQVACAPFVAITGTNGKTTTTALVAHLLRSGGVTAEAVGNIGRPAIGAAETMPSEGVIVAECSSFQLASTLDFHPHVAVLLNITPDHIDWHGSMDVYVADKARIFANMGEGDVAIVDVDDPGAAPWADEVVSRGVTVVRVSHDGADGARIEDDTLVVDIGSGPVTLVRVDELLIRGSHNVANALAASCAALAAGAAPDAVRAGLRTFSPIEHRLQVVATVAGVEYVDDSKATNPDAVLKALTAFDDRPVIVLLGGRNKGNDFAALAEACAARCTLSVAYGESRDDLHVALEAAGAPHEVTETMLEALALARGSASGGGVVLLSPACASFDEFRDYEERGRRFASAVDALARGTR